MVVISHFYNESTKCEKLRKLLSYGTRSPAITDNYSPSVMCVYTDHIISLLKKVLGSLCSQNQRKRLFPNLLRIRRW